MPVSRLPETHATLYAELLEQALVYERAAAAAGFLPGGPVAKVIGGRRYLYWQLRAGGHTTQRYLGRDEPALRRALVALGSRRRDLDEDRRNLDRLSAMLMRGGALREGAAAGTALALLGDLGFFRRGAVLVGTQAFRAYGNALGVNLEGATLRTQDIDLAQALDVAVASSAEPAPATEGELERLGFLPVPGLDPREPSTSFKVRGRELRIDFLVPARQARAQQPIHIPALGVAAQPLPFLDYLIEEPIPAVVLAHPPTLVRVPRPGRFALHKLWTASSRGVSQAMKSRKDRAQASALLEILAEDRPDELREAWQSLQTRARGRAIVAAEVRKLPSLLAAVVLRAEGN